MRAGTADGTGPPIEEVSVSAYTIPTRTEREQDGTLTWDDTTVVVAEVSAGGETGLGYTYEHEACGTLIAKKLAGVIERESALQVKARWLEMYRS
ncbi:MAG: hypothetical protein R3320_14440, partial [Nitriliruptorales bacterium]|nr:hypothetical protein [Nitriliruptorales bacterium]